MGKMHARCYAEMPGAELVAVHDLEDEESEKLAEEHGCDIRSSAEQLVESDEVDAVDICLPTYLHCRHVALAAQAGKHVVCEKPFAVDAAEAEATVGMVRRAGIVFMCAHVIRFWPEYRLLKQYADEQLHGRLLSLDMERMSIAPVWSWQQWYLDKDLSGGAATDLHCHDTDFVRYLLGEPMSVDSVGTHHPDRGWDHIFTNYHYPDVAVTARGGWNLPPSCSFHMAYRAVFEDAMLTYDSTHDPPLVLATDQEETPLQPPGPDLGTTDAGGNIGDLGAYYGELSYFVDCVANSREPEIVAAEDSVKTVALLQAEKRSAAEKSSR
jgi:predicted dehydrogenase